MAGRPWTLRTIHDRCVEEGDCWIWKQGVKGDGYPQACVEGKKGTHVRLLAYKLSGKEPAPGMRVVMKCEHRLCCNPKHMEQVTISEVRVRTHASGGYSGMKMYLHRVRHMQTISLAKLDMDKAREIRAKLADGKTPAQLAAEYGVGKTAIRRIRQGLTYRETPEAHFFARAA